MASNFPKAPSPSPAPKSLVVYVGQSGNVIALGLDNEPLHPMSEPHTAYALPLDTDVQIGQPLVGYPFVPPGMKVDSDTRKVIPVYELKQAEKAE